MDLLSNASLAFGPPLQFFRVGVLFEEDFAGKVIVQFVGIYGFDDDALPVFESL